MIEWVSSFKLGIKFKCLRCASCCRNIRQGVSLTDKGYLRIQKAVQGMSLAEPISHPVFGFNLYNIRGKCIALDGINCLVYAVRPLLCRLYPFQVGVKHDGKLLICLNHCPGVDQPDGELIDERYIQDEILGTILKLEGKDFVKRLQAYFMSIKKQVTPLLQTRNKVIYSDWNTKGMLERMILDLLYSDSFDELTPWERLRCIYYDALLPLTSHIANQTAALVTEQDVMQGYEAVKHQLNITLLESVDLTKRHRQRLEREGHIIFEKQNELLVVHSPENEVPIRDSMGEEFTMRMGDILKAIPMSKDAIAREINYFSEIIQREGMYGAVVCDVPIDKEVLLLMRVADALELIANAFTVKKGKDCVEASEIVDAIRSVDGSLTDIAAATIGL